MAQLPWRSTHTTAVLVPPSESIDSDSDGDGDGAAASSSSQPKKRTLKSIEANHLLAAGIRSFTEHEREP